MPTRYDTEDDSRESATGDREISLGTGTVLAIFLALALVCSLFFGLGYSMGRKSAPATLAAAVTPSALSRGADERPSPESVAAPRRGTLDHAPDSDLQVVQPMPGTASSRESGEAANVPIGRAASSRSGPHDRPAAATEVPQAPSPDASTAVIPGLAGTQSFVQVAAVSRKEDAELLLTALKRRGYAGLIRQQTLDNLLHVQVGPFPTKKDAEAMRQRLITDGYNPIIK